MSRRTRPRFPQRHRPTAPKRGALLGLILGAALATALVGPASAASPDPITYWTKCSLHVRRAGVEVSPVEVLHLTCAQANQAIRRARILLTPRRPDLLDAWVHMQLDEHPSARRSLPVELPGGGALTGAQHRQLSFIWDWAS